jgi:hypothetical protein
MKAVITASVVLAVLVTLVSIVIAATGLHENPMVVGPGFILVAIVINLGAVFWALKSNAAEAGYGRQLGNGALIGIIAGVVIFLASFVLLTYVFPDYIAEMRAGTLEFMEGAGVPQDKLDQQAAAMEAMTPATQALNGTLGTFFTSLVGAAILAIFLRKK